MEKQKVNIESAIHAHVKWFIHLRSVIELGSSEFDPQVVRADNNCDFGKWLYGAFPADLKELPVYQEIKQLHADFHAHAAKVLQLAIDKDKDSAFELMKPESEFKKTSLALIIRLNRLRDLIK